MPEANAIDYAILEDLIEKLGSEQVRCMLDEVTVAEGSEIHRSDSLPAAK